MGGFHLANTELIMSLERRIDMEEVKRKGRGKGKKPPMISTSIRLSTEIVEFFKGKYPQKWQSEMRKVLVNFLDKEKQNGSS